MLLEGSLFCVFGGAKPPKTALLAIIPCQNGRQMGFQVGGNKTKGSLFCVFGGAKPPKTALFAFIPCQNGNQIGFRVGGNTT